LGLNRILLTGGIGAGKSTISQCFADDGWNVLKADNFGYLSTRKGGEFYETMRELSGDKIKLDDKEGLDWSHFIYFQVQNRLFRNKWYNLLYDRLMTKIAASGDDKVVLEMATITEHSLQKCPFLKVAIVANDNIRIQRVLARRGLASTDENAVKAIRLVMQDQLTQAEYGSLCDIKLLNNGGDPKKAYQGLKAMIGVG
jgi:dephospho-CoA kinase